MFSEIKTISFVESIPIILRFNLLWYVKQKRFSFCSTRKAKAASGRLSYARGYNQTCHYYQNLQADIRRLHAKFHQNPWCGVGEKCSQDNDFV